MNTSRIGQEWGVGNSLLLEGMYISIVILESNVENVPYPAILLRYTPRDTFVNMDKEAFTRMY